MVDVYARSAFNTETRRSPSSAARVLGKSLDTAGAGVHRQRAPLLATSRVAGYEARIMPKAIPQGVPVDYRPTSAGAPGVSLGWEKAPGDDKVAREVVAFLKISECRSAGATMRTNWNVLPPLSRAAPSLQKN
jgi:hypothetical protein